jgi:hypothetical protein
MSPTRITVTVHLIWEFAPHGDVASDTEFPKRHGISVVLVAVTSVPLEIVKPKSDEH